MSTRVAFGPLLAAALAALSAHANPARAAGADPAADAHAQFDGIWRNSGQGRKPPDAPLGPCCTEEGWDDYARMLQPWAMQIMARREEALKIGKPLPTNTAMCRPDGMPTVIEIPYTFEFVRAPTRTYILYEADYQSRRIRMNSTHPAGLKPGWYGDSIGYWEGETLVIDTIGLNALGQINWDGIPHTEALHIVERYTVTAPRSLELKMTLTDPGTLTGPWTITKHFRKLNENRLLEYVCAQNNQDMAVPTE
jgi:hypothetical protein